MYALLLFSHSLVALSHAIRTQPRLIRLLFTRYRPLLFSAILLGELLNAPPGGRRGNLLGIYGAVIMERIEIKGNSVTPK